MFCKLRKTNKDTNKQPAVQVKGHTDKETKRQRDKETKKQTNSYMDRYPNS